MAKIKFCEQDMYNHVYFVIRDRYPFNQGYIIKIQDASKVGYRPDFLVQKQIRYNKTSYYHKAIFEVKADAIITASHIAQINWYAMNHAGKHSFIIGKYLVIPSYANIDGVRDLIKESGVEVIWMRGFHR